jgi:predicted transcriptional regulator of viral defense system
MKGTQSLADFVDALQQGARYSFTRNEVESVLGLASESLTKALQRLHRNGRIHRLRRGFYAIIPLEYRSSGMIPLDWYIDDLMRFLGVPYYVGVLSAAAMHGAGHQQPQEHHVVVPTTIRPVRTPVLRIRFFCKAACEQTQIESVRGFSGWMPVSTRGATVMDCVRFASTIGGLDAVLTVLDELCATMTSDDLLDAVRHEPDISIVQRTGWLLERIADPALLHGVHDWLRGRKVYRTRLDVREPARGYSSDPRWHVIVNSNPESEA